jgi:hypothetical protein
MRNARFVKFLAVPALLCAMLLAGCSMTDYEIEKEGHTWRFVGLVDDSTALVSVALEQWGEEHDHHLMGWDDDFHWTKDASYYPVKMNSYWRGKGSSSVQDTLPQKAETDDYTIRYEKLDKYFSTCGAILSDRKGNDLDTLELERCSSDSARFVGSYVRIDNGFYLVQDDRFPRQRPAYRFEYAGGAIKFTDANGDYIIYGGKP